MQLEIGIKNNNTVMEGASMEGAIVKQNKKLSVYGVTLKLNIKKTQKKGLEDICSI